MDSTNQIVRYYDNLNPEIRQKLEQLKSIILDTVPNAIESMAYGVPCYSFNENAKMDQKIMIAGFKKHISLYPHPDTIEVFQEQLKPYVLKKGTIQFQLNQDLPEDLIKEMILYRYNQSC